MNLKIGDIIKQKWPGSWLHYVLFLHLDPKTKKHKVLAWNANNNVVIMQDIFSFDYLEDNNYEVNWTKVND